MTPLDLASDWRSKAAEWRTLAAEGQAATLEACATELEEWWRIREAEPLTLQEAAVESGYSYDYLQHMVGGVIPNMGEKGSPRVRRSDLPRKPGRGHTPRPVEQDLADERMARELSG